MKNLPNSIKWYISVLFSLAVVILYHSFTVVDLDWISIKSVLFFILMAAIAVPFSVEFPRGGNISVDFVIHLACIVLFGPEVTVCVALFGELLSKKTIMRESPFYKTIFNMSQLVLTVWCAGTVYVYLGGEINAQPTSTIIPFIGATLVYSFINIGAVTIVLALAQQSSPWAMWLINFRGNAPNFLAFTTLSLLMVAVYKLAGVLGGILFFLPLLLARSVFKSYMEVRQVYIDTLNALASALDAKDKYTKGHSDRVTEYAMEIARALKMSEDKIETIERMAQLHDIGKIGVSGEVLTKPGKLSDSEFEQIKQHPVIGANILKNVRDFEDSIDFVRYHHEKYDGSGYPYGLKGEQIPLEARILTLADSFDAMTSNRSYRNAISLQDALEEVRRCSGTHFDPKVVEAFLQCWEDGTISSIANKTNAEQDLSVS